MEEKKCGNLDCSQKFQYLPLSEFGENNSNEDGLQKLCKVCYKKSFKSMIFLPKQKYRERQKKQRREYVNNLGDGYIIQVLTDKNCSIQLKKDDIDPEIIKAYRLYLAIKRISKWKKSDPPPEFKNLTNIERFDIMIKRNLKEMKQ